jgi:hypothetical protein
MNAPDPFAHGGQQDDAALIDAEREILAIHERRKACPDDAAGVALWEKLSDEEDRLEDVIYLTPPATLADCAVKLRMLRHPELGIEARDWFDQHGTALDHVLAYLESMVPA